MRGTPALATPNPTELLGDIRARVESWILENNQKRSALAEECGVDTADLTHFLTGNRTLPPYALAKLADKIHMDPARLLVHWGISQFESKCQYLEKRLSAKKGPSEGEDSRILAHPRPRERLQRLLWAFFLGDLPPESCQGPNQLLRRELSSFA